MSLGLLEGLHKDGSDWKARCPAHADRVASLAIKIADGDKLLLHCHAGCQTADILKKWGVNWDVLFPDQPLPNGANPRDPEKTWDYLDEQGNLLFQVCRLPGKKFIQRHLDDHGEWVPNVRHVRRVLYRLPELVKAPPDAWVFIAEGEKDSDALAAQGLVATTSPMGAGKWRDEYAKPLMGRKVAILPDNDEPGLEHARQIARTLLPVAERVVVLDLFDPNSEEDQKKDVSDWLAQKDHDAAALTTMAEDSVSVSVSVLAVPIGTAEQKTESSGLLLVSARQLLAEKDEEPPDLVSGLLPEAGLSVIGAKPKVGKSTFVRCLAIAVAKGHDFLGRTVRQGGTIYLALEEKRREVREHFRRLGMEDDDPLFVFFGASPQDGLARLINSIRELQPVLVVIDPLFRFVRVKDVSDYAGIINALDPVITVARITGAHLMLVHHNTKAEREGGDDLLGSTGIFASVDTAIMMRRKADHTRFAYSIQRYGKDMDATVLTMTDDGLIVAADSLEGYEVGKATDRILEFLENEPEPIAELELRERLEINKARLIKALNTLFNEGRISRFGSGKRGDPFKFTTPWWRQEGNEKQQE